MERIKVHFSGQVQGVGFRYTTHQIASQFELTGFVKNLDNGKVLVVAEGSSHELTGFLNSIENQMGGYVRNVEKEKIAATGEFRTFAIER